MNNRGAGQALYSHGSKRRVFILSGSGIGYNVEAMDICGGVERSRSPRMDAEGDKSVRNCDATFLRGEPCAVCLEFARTFARGGDWRDFMSGGGAGSSLPGAPGPVANDSCRAV